MTIEPVLPTPASEVGPAASAEAAAEADAVEGGLFAPHRRQLVIGLVLTVTLVAFEAMAIAAIMPDVKDDLGGLGLYGWVFSGFFLASLLGIVVAGQLADTRGLVLPYTVGLGLFSVGLVVGGGAASMPMLVAGRILQGFGAGAIPAIGYAAIGRGIPSPLRPKMFAVMSTAWVVPGLVGPSAALLVEHALSWRFVFLILVPLVIVAGIMTVPVLAAMGAPVGADLDDDAHAARRTAENLRLRQVVLLVLGIGAAFVAASGVPVVVAVVLFLVGVPLAVNALVHLLPHGTLRLERGVPATVAVRGLLTFGFFAADAYVPLAVVDGRGGSSWIAGAALTVSALTWTAASWIQAHLIDRIGPRALDRIGFTALAAGVGTMLGVALGLPVALAVVAWAISGFGIGIAYAPQAVTVLASAKPGEEGSASAAIQLADAVGIALGVGVGGGIISLGDGRGWAVDHTVTWVFALALAGALGGLLASGRMPKRVPAQAT
ncbi:MFS transporter [Aquihabitans sp. McL0605]|uniref:MFS transporter n=1 Tax=Aquihabitans sp. McL0605 TaxID=3415671 RepID=UPI003CF1E723